MIDYDRIAETVTPDQLADAIGAEKIRDRYRCPLRENHSNEDKNPSFSIWKDGRRTVAKCHACDLAGSPVTVAGQVWHVEPAEAARRLADHIGLLAEDDRPGGLGQIVQTYEYVDADWNPVRRVVRFEPKAFRQQRPDGNGGWTWGTKGTRNLLYNLPDVLAAVQHGKPVIIVEGEKDADRLRDAWPTVAATTCPQGAGKWKIEHTGQLKGADVVILPDNDAAGIAHAREVAAALLGVSVRVRIVNLPGLEPKCDVSDWLDANHTVDELKRLIRAAPSWEPEAPDTAETAISQERLPCETLADIDASPSQPLLLDMIEPDGPTLLYGAGGIGKGTTATWMLRELLALGIRPLIYDAENRPKEWARRADGLGIDRSRVIYTRPPTLPAEIHGKPFWDGVAPYLGRLARQEGCGAIVIDSVLTALNLSEERSRSDPSAPYRYVAALDALQVPSISLGHTAKNATTGDPYGSVAWINAMRLTWLGTAAAGEGHRVRWQPKKRNERGKIDGVQLVFRYGDDNRLCGVERLDDERTTREWILDQFADQGPLTVTELAENMVSDDDDYSAAALERATELIRKTLYRMKKVGQAKKTSNKRGAPWCPC